MGKDETIDTRRAEERGQTEKVPSGDAPLPG